MTAKYPVSSLLLFLTALHLSAATYYVKPTGSDSKSGTSIANAWQSIDKVNNISFAAGDSILFEGGEVLVGNLNFWSDDKGTAAKPIVISSYGSGRATIDAQNGTGFSAYNTASIIVKNLNFVGSGRVTNTGNGLSVYADSSGDVKLEFVRIESVDVSGFGNTGIVLGSWKGNTGYRDVRITRSNSHHNGSAGISTYGYFPLPASTWCHEDVYIGYCKTYENEGQVGVTNSHTGNGIVLGQVDGGTIEYCESYQNGAGNTHCGGPVGLWAWDCNNMLIQYNESHHNTYGQSGCDGGGFDFDGGITNSVMQYNYSHDNDGPGYLICQFDNAREFKNVVVRYNISENDSRRLNYGSGFHFWSSTTGSFPKMSNIDIYNNTVYTNSAASGKPGAAIKIGSNNIYNTFIRNNIFQTIDGVPLVNVGNPASVTFQENSYWSTGSNFQIRWNGTNYSSLNAWRIATGQEKNGTANTGMNVDPALTNPGTGGTIGLGKDLIMLSAYKLTSGSPMIDNGLDLTNLFGLDVGVCDFYRAKLPQGTGYDIGAHEFAKHAYFTCPDTATVEVGKLFSYAIQYQNPLSGAPQIQFPQGNPGWIIASPALLQGTAPVQVRVDTFVAYLLVDDIPYDTLNLRIYVVDPGSSIVLFESNSEESRLQILSAKSKTDFIVCCLTVPTKGIYRFSLLDISGKLLWIQNLAAEGPGLFKIKTKHKGIDLNSKANGVYLLHVQGNGFSNTKRVYRF